MGYFHSKLEQRPLGSFSIGKSSAGHQSTEQKLLAGSLSVKMPVGPYDHQTPGFSLARLRASMKKSPLVIDNVLRLYDGATPDSASVITQYLQDTPFPVTSAAHDCMVQADPLRFELVLADRLLQINERCQRTEIKAELAALGHRKPPRAKPDLRRKQVAAQKASESVLLSTQIGLITSRFDVSELSLQLNRLCDERNNRGVLTKTGKPWTLPNLRKRLKKMRAAKPDALLWQHLNV